MALWKEEPKSAGGSFIPPVKFDAQSGRMKRVDRGLNGSEEVDISRSFKAIFDMDSVEIGWAKFVRGQAPSWAMVPWSDDAVFPAQPDPEHKRAFRLYLKLSKECGGDIREFGGSSGALRGGFNQIHDQWITEASSNPGKLPVIVMRDSRAIVTETRMGKNTNYAPVFEIVNWVARPADLPVRQAVNQPAPAQTTRAAPPATGAVRAAPPPPPPPPAAVEDEDDFG